MDIPNASVGDPNTAIIVPKNAVSVYPSLPRTNNTSPTVAAISIPQNIPLSVIQSGFSKEIIEGNHTDALKTAKNKNKYTSTNIIENETNKINKRHWNENWKYRYY